MTRSLARLLRALLARRSNHAHPREGETETEAQRMRRIERSGR